MKTIKILLAEDHNIVRQGLIDILDKYEDICIVAEAENGADMVNKYFENKPDLVLSDIEMPGMDGFKAAEEILSKDKSARIIFLSMYSTDDYIYHAFKIGAFGLIPKSVIKSELIRAVRMVAEGLKYFKNKSESELKEMVSRYKKENIALIDNEILTMRDKAILEFIAEGLTSEEIGGRLSLSKRTIDVERSRIMVKLNMKEPHHLVVYAVKHFSKKNEPRIP
jgi:two-component system, NarL family, response regulator NreC